MEIPTQLNPNHDRWYWNPESIIRLQEFFGPAWEMPFRTITLLADSTVVLALAMVILWTRGRRIAYTALAATMLGALITTIIKLGADVPRPEHVEMIAYETRIAPAFPSGHAMHSVAFWGTLAYLGLVRVPIVVVIAIGVMLSRIFLGIHYPIDVMIGGLIGLGGILIGHICFTRILPRFSDAALGNLTGYLFLGGVVILPVANQFPIGWELIGALVGGGLGTLIEVRKVGYRPEAGHWRATITRAMVGAGGFILLGFLILLTREVSGAPFLRLLVAFPLGMWAMLGAPWVLDRMGLNDAGPPVHRVSRGFTIAR